MSIRLEHVLKRFGELVILQRTSLEVRDGEFFVLLGASGSGKTTLLRIIAGLEPADEGLVLLHDRDVTWAPPQERNIGMVFQNYLIFRHMTVAENIEFGLRLRGTSLTERRRRREELLDLVGLAGLDNRFPHQLSGGQQQRVALARALAYNPEVLLLDEPFGALDVQIRSSLRRNLKRIQRSLGVTTILVTHDQEEAFELADRIGILERGHLLEVGRPGDLYWRPKVSFTASFLGGGALIVGRVEQDKARFGHLSLELPDELQAEGLTRVQLMIRPEQVALLEEAPEDRSVCLGKGEVLEDWFVGAYRRVRLRLPHLPGTRQAHPVPPFGEPALLVDALLPGSLSAIASAYWAVLNGWHLLRAPDFRFLLVCFGGDTKAPHRPLLGKWLVERLEATALCLLPNEVSSPADRQEEKRESEAVSDRAESPKIELRPAGGNIAEAMSRELKRSLYDFLVLECRTDIAREDAARRFQELFGELTTALPVPTFAVVHSQEEIRHMLICTGAGEPGKEDIRLGGRLARRLGLPVTLLHVYHPQTSPEFARRHLDRAAATLQGLDLDVKLHVTAGEDVAETIVQEARRLECDLIVIGAHLEQPSWLTDQNITRRILAKAPCAVLIVPPPIELRSTAPSFLHTLPA